MNHVIRKHTFYRNDPKFSDIYVKANSAVPDQTAPSSLIRVFTVCYSICIQKKR